MRLRAAACALLLAAPARAWPQASTDEARVGSDRELYLRVAQLLIGHRRDAWEIRPLAPARMAPPNVSWLPWNPAPQDRLRARGTTRLLRPASSMAFNGSFPWDVGTGAAWEGKGLNASATLGATARASVFTARIEPVLAFAANAAFQLEPLVGFRDAMRPSAIDEPQRFGATAWRFFDAGESYIRADAGGLGVGFSNERLFWGPGIRHAILFSSGGARFPHVFAGTSGPLATRIEALNGQLIYGRLDESRWAPPSASTRRFGTGVIGSWTPRFLPINIGAARFYHRLWPSAFRATHLLAPFGSVFYDAQTFAGAAADNQLATVFFSARMPRARLEFFGEFGRNDRSVDARDLSLEPEHNSAWLAGFLHAFAVDSARRSLWSVRYEAANGRVSAIQSIGRDQSTFYEHAPITQGHTQRGLLLGTPLIDRSRGSELAVDRWTTQGRLGASVMERQMPPDLRVGMPPDRARSQWDLRLSALRFVGTSELSLQLGHVWDLNRFPQRDLGNLYMEVGWRQGLER